ncbi:Delta-1-pyrroline-5-carboxylate dehydrogenase, mitochondrial, partial [Schistosoma japonicum]
NIFIVGSVKYFIFCSEHFLILAFLSLQNICRSYCVCRCVLKWQYQKAISRPFKAVNEPVLLYKPGSMERLRLDSTLGTMKLTAPHRVPICIGSSELSSEHPRKQVWPFEHSKTLANFYYASEEQINSAIQSCLAARDSWSRTSFDERAKIFLKAADLISNEHREELLASTILGQAKTIFQAEIDAAAELADFLRFNVQFASEALLYRPINTKDAINKVVYRPNEGFWAAIPPFNFTAIAGNLVSAPALMGKCCNLETLRYSCVL